MALPVSEALNTLHVLSMSAKNLEGVLDSFSANTAILAVIEKLATDLLQNISTPAS